MPFYCSSHCFIRFVPLLHSDPFPLCKPFLRVYALRVFRVSFAQPCVSCVGVGVNQKVAGALQVPCKGATSATSSSQIARHTPTLRFQKSNWTIHLKRMLAERLPRSAQTREYNIQKHFPLIFHALLPLRVPRFEPGG